MKASPDPGARARALPKVLLHEHLDGGLRVATLLDLLQQRGMAEDLSWDGPAQRYLALYRQLWASRLQPAGAAAQGRA